MLLINVLPPASGSLHHISEVRSSKPQISLLTDGFPIIYDVFTILRHDVLVREYEC